MLRNIFVALIIIGASLSLFSGGAFYALLFYLWNAYFRPEQWIYNSWVLQLRLSWVIGLVLLALTFGTLSRAKPRHSSQTVLIVLFFAQTFVSTLSSTAFDYSWFWWIEFAKVMIIGYLITLHVDTVTKLRWLVVILAISLGFEATKQGLAQLVLNPGATNANEHPVLGDNNGVAVGMFMLAPLMIALANTTKRRWEEWGWVTACIGIVYRGISTYSRGGLLAASAIGLVHLGNSRRRIQALLLVAVAATVSLSVMPQQFWDRMNTINLGDSEERDSSAAGRLYFWQVATKMAADKPLTGVGFNAFSRNFNAYDETNGAYGYGRAVHSTWFGILGETGFPGLILLVAIVFRCFIACRRAHRMLKGQKGEDAETVFEISKALQSTFIAYVVGGSFINAHYSELFWHLAWFTIAVECIARDVRHNINQRPAVPAPVPLRPVSRPRPRPYAVAR